MSTTALGDPSADPSVPTDKFQPVDIDNNPITLGDNPAHVDGALHEFGLWLERTGLFQALLENRAVALANGKCAVESPSAALFVSGKQSDADTFNFENPCPPIIERIALFDANAALHSSPKFTSISAMPTDLTDQFVTNKYTVNTEDKLFMSSLLKMITDSDLAQQLVSAAGGSGYVFYKLLRERIKDATAQDRALVKSDFESFKTKGHAGPVTLSSFNLFYKSFSKLHRVLPKDERMKEAQLCEMLNTVMFKDSNLSALYEMKLTVSPHNGILKTALDTIRTLLRSREVRRALCEPALLSFATSGDASVESYKAAYIVLKANLQLMALRADSPGAPSSYTQAIAAGSPWPKSMDKEMSNHDHNETWSVIVEVMWRATGLVYCFTFVLCTGQ